MATQLAKGKVKHSETLHMGSKKKTGTIYICKPLSAVHMSKIVYDAKKITCANCKVILARELKKATKVAKPSATKHKTSKHKPIEQITEYIAA